MTEDSPATLSILVPAEDADRDRFEVRFRRKEVPVDSLRNSLADYLAKMEDALNGVPASLSGYQVDEITQPRGERHGQGKYARNRGRSDRDRRSHPYS